MLQSFAIVIVSLLLAALAAVGVATVLFGRKWVDDMTDGR